MLNLALAPSSVLNGTLVENRTFIFKDECADLSFNKCPTYTHGGASSKFSTNSHKASNNGDFIGRLAIAAVLLYIKK